MDWQRVGKSEENNAVFPLFNSLDSTKKVSDVLKLFEDGEMAEYLQGDVSGHWEIASFTNSSPPLFLLLDWDPQLPGIILA